MDGPVALSVAIVYAAALFALAAAAERRRIVAQRLRRPAYALALAVYCTSWTFFGGVGSAVAEGWNYLPIFLGPILVYLLAPGFLRRLIGAVQREGATSLSDFIAARFGRSRGVAVLVTLLALFGTVPYLALQLRSIGMSYAELTGGGAEAAMAGSAVMLGAFAILFGTRRFDAAARNEGLLVAVAAESVVKLAAMVAVGIFAAMLVFGLPSPVRADAGARFAAHFTLGGIGPDFAVILLLSAAAIVCLPRQFYIGVIEAASPGDAHKARAPFILYLIAVSALVPLIALAGMATLPPGARADLYVLDVPLAAGADMLALLVVLGGFSAAAGMAIVESVALSTMVSNDLVAPLLIRAHGAEHEKLGPRLLWVRRIAIGAIMAAALSYGLAVPAGGRLAAIGLIAFAAMIQFAPVLIMAVNGANRDALAAKAGLGTGLALWLWTLMLPTILPPAWTGWLEGTALDPRALFGLTGLSPLTHGVLWSLGLNLLVFGAVVARRVRAPALPGLVARREGVAEARDMGGLLRVVERFAEPEAIRATFGRTPDLAAPVDPRSARAAERLIAGVVGAPSARAVMATALSGATLRLADVARMLDEGGQSLRFSKGLLAATLENIDPGVSVVDRELNVVAWNSRYLELFEYPPGLLRVGVPVAELIRYNALRGDCGPGEAAGHVARRLDHMRRGQRHSFERRRPDGRVIKTVGGPMPGGGYVMCFTDITAEAEAREGLERARAELERRVAERTRELESANARLAEAGREKTRFLAAASHDLLQPLHAARLFSAALARETPPSAHPIIGQVDRSIAAADALLRALLDISKLDAGGIRPRPTRFALSNLIGELAQSFAPQAAEKGLALGFRTLPGVVETDRALFRSILQNLISNAVRYTRSGRVLVAMRRRSGLARVEVYDTGPGIAPDDQARIFREFERLDSGAEAGAGLGLAIVERTARLIGATVELRSVAGRGSRFSVTLPLAAGTIGPAAPALPQRQAAAGALLVLVVDDQPHVREATAALLRAWGYGVRTASGVEEALQLAGGIGAALIDLQLGAGPDGVALAQRLGARVPGLRAAIVTADRRHETAARVARAGLPMFQKPLDPAELRLWLAGGAALLAAE